MNYYKIKLTGTKNIIGAVCSNDFRRIQKRNGFIIFATEEDGQFIYYNDKYYRDNWMIPIGDNPKIEIIDIEAIRIDKDEYNGLAEAFQTEQEIVVEPEPEQEETIPQEEETDEAVEYVRQMKIEQMKKACTQTIEAGFDIVLSDEKPHHFSLTENDQLNLITLSMMIESGETLIPYHADGELCTFFSKEDAMAILNQAIMYKTYITTTFNSLKLYVNSLKTIAEIHAVQFGMELPVEYQSDVYKYFNSGGQK